MTTEVLTTVAQEFSDAHISLSEVFIVANPVAASVTPDLVAAIEERFASAGGSVRTHWTRTPGDGGRIVTEHRGGGLIVAVGGDGTVAEVAAAMLAAGRQDRALLALPGGSGNSTSRNLWGDLDCPQILDILPQSHEWTVRPIDLMHLNEPDATVLLGTSTGFLAQVLIDARHVDPAITGIERYYEASAGVLQSMPAHPTRVTVDGVVLHEGTLSSVAVGGGRYRARFFEFLPESILDDGLLDVSTIAALDAEAVAELVPLLLSGQHRQRSEVRYGRGRRVVIERLDGKSLVAEFDGEVWDAAGPTLSIDIVPRALRVLAPATAPSG